MLKVFYVYRIYFFFQMSLSFYHAEFKIPFSFFYYGSPCFLRIQAAPSREGGSAGNWDEKARSQLRKVILPFFRASQLHRSDLPVTPHSPDDWPQDPP